MGIPILSAAAKEEIRKQGKITFKSLRGPYFKCNQDLKMPKFRKNQIPGLVKQAFPRHNIEVVSVVRQSLPYVPIKREEGRNYAHCPKCYIRIWEPIIGNKYHCSNWRCTVSYIVAPPTPA